MRETLTIREIEGTELDPWLDALGDLRIRVFREFPYLYEGSLDYERDYLEIYQKCDLSRIVLITDSTGILIGATTCIPLTGQSAEFQQPFLNAGMEVNRFLYFGESIIRPEWRGLGLGKEFFNRREAHAQRLGLDMTTFCAVDRPANHPLRPSGYRSLDGFWASRGYEKQPGLKVALSWKEIGEEENSPKTLTFWTKSWTD